MSNYIDLVDVERELLKAAGWDATTRRLDETTGRESMVVRRLPPTILTTYHDGGRLLNYPFQVVVRRRSELASLSDADEASMLLDGAEAPSMDGSYEFHRQYIYTPPQALGIDEDSFYACEFRVMALIDVKGTRHDQTS